MQQQLDKLLIKYLTGSASESEAEKVLRWIKESPENKKYYYEFQQVYQITKILQKPSGFNKEEGWNRIRAGYLKAISRNREKESKRRNNSMLWRVALPAAAVVLLAFLLGMRLGRNQHKPVALSKNNTFNEVVAQKGSKSEILLSDGTRVWLNAGSSLRYPAVFSDSVRTVFLTGEAFFDVTPDNNQLFMVRTGDLDVKVYGTKFNIKSYPEENIIQTTLIEGSLTVQPVKGEGKNDPLLVKPNETVMYYKTSSSMVGQKKNEFAGPDDASNLQELKPGELQVISQVNTLPITSWKDDRWVFIGESLQELAVKLERRYNVRISFQDEGLKNYRFTGTLKEETFEQVLKILQISAPILYSIQDDNVTFKVNKAAQTDYDKKISNPD